MGLLEGTALLIGDREAALRELGIGEDVAYLVAESDPLPARDPAGDGGDVCVEPDERPRKARAGRRQRRAARSCDQKLGPEFRLKPSHRAADGGMADAEPPRRLV
jgi:hypothetical protein